MVRLWSDTDADTETVMLRMLREASGAKRFAMASALTSSVIELSRKHLRRDHPEASEMEIRLKWVGLHYGPELERELRDDLERRRSR
jgi:hypothetical protein